MRVSKTFYVDVERSATCSCCGGPTTVDDQIQVEIELDVYPATFNNPAEINEVNRDARWVDDTQYGTPLTDAEYAKHEAAIEQAIEND